MVRVATLAAVVALAMGAALATAAADKKKKNEPTVPLVRTFDVAVRDSWVFLAQTSGLSLWDLSEVGHPRELVRLTLPGTVRGIALDGDRAYLAASTRGLYVTQIVEREEEPPEFQMLTRFDTPGSVRQVVVMGDRVLLADDRYGIRVVDVSLPSRPLQRALVSTRDKVRSLALHGDLLATAEDTAGVRLFDVSRPEAPRELGVLREVDKARDVAFAGDRLLVAAGPQGLLVYRVDEDRRVHLEAELVLDDPAEFVGGSATLALVSGGKPVVHLIGLDDSSTPSRLTDLRMHRAAPARRIVFVGDRAYLAMDTAGVGVIDLADRLAPEVLLPRERRLRIEFPTLDEVTRDR